MQQRDVDADAARFHAFEHRDERQLDAFVDVDECRIALKFRRQHLFQRDRDVGFFAEVLLVWRERRTDFVVEREQRGRFRDFFARRYIALQPVARNVAEGVAGQAGIVDVRHDHRVGESRRQWPAVRGQSPELQLDVVRNKEAIGLQQRLQRVAELGRAADGIRNRHDERLGLLHR